VPAMAPREAAPLAVADAAGGDSDGGPDSVNGRSRGRRRRKSFPGLLRSIAPELVSGASDNDPTNVGTAVAVGARSAYQLSWVALLVAPLLAVVQTIAAHVGVVARNDLQTLAVERYGRRLGAILLVSVVVVNVVTIAADLQAGAAGIGVLVGLDPRWLVVPLGLALVGLLLLGRYEEVATVLRYLLLGFLAFGAAAVLAQPDWSRLLRASLVPALSLRHGEVAGALALLGTTLTSYVYVWETVSRGREEPLEESPENDRLARTRIGAVAGAVFTALVLWFMLVASAATLGQQHESVRSVQDAAAALGPLAGSLTTELFALGLLTSAVVALPVLMATTAYVVGAQFDWRRGLSERVRQARRFYAILAASIGLGLAVTLAGVSVIGMLVVASVIGGLGTPFGLVVLVRLARDPVVMGARPISSGLAIAGFTVAIVVGGFGLLLVIAALLD
jgi:Mn2+/Fe2+ NRAMP family transporter